MKFKSKSLPAMKLAAALLTIAPFVVAIAFSAIPSIARAETPFLGPLARPVCQPGDRTETGLDGQLTLAERASGASLLPYNCNLKVVGQYLGEGADHMTAWQDECDYFTTYSDTAGTGTIPEIAHPGIQVVDVRHPENPTWYGNLDVPAFVQPWESFYANHTRHLLGAVEGDGAAGVKPGFAIYDTSADCRHPQVLSSINLPDSTFRGHGGDWAADGNTFYGTDQVDHHLVGIDTTDPKNPYLVYNHVFATGEVGQYLHRVTPNEMTQSGHPPGTLLYAGVTASGISAPGVFGTPNGLVIFDTSEIQSRLPDPQIYVVSTLSWTDGAAATSPTEAMIGGTPYIIIGDEGGADSVGHAAAIASCKAGLPPWGYQRLVNISNLNNPTIVAHLILQVQEPANCSLTENDNTTTGFGYDSHDCNVDNPRDAKLLACAWQQSGVRVFDIHNPYHPVEIAYYKGAARGNATPLPGSSSNGLIDPTWTYAKAYSRFVWKDGELYLWLISADSGLVITKFENQAAIAALNLKKSPGNEEPNN